MQNMNLSLRKLIAHRNVPVVLWTELSLIFTSNSKWGILKEGNKNIHNLCCIKICFSRNLPQFINHCKQQMFPAIYRHQDGPVTTDTWTVFTFVPPSIGLSLYSFHFCHRQLKGVKTWIKMHPVAFAGTMLAFHWNCAIVLAFICLTKCLFFTSTLHLRRRRTVVPFHYWYSKWVVHWNS